MSKFVLLDPNQNLLSTFTIGRKKKQREEKIPRVFATLLPQASQ